MPQLRTFLLCCLLLPAFNLAAAQPAYDYALLIVGPDDAAVGLVADRVVAVRRATQALAPTPSSTAGRGLAWVRGVDADFNLHLDLAALLADPRLIVHEEAETQ